jgi:hypothetical protein
MNKIGYILVFDFEIKPIAAFDLKVSIKENIGVSE